MVVWKNLVIYYIIYVQEVFNIYDWRKLISNELINNDNEINHIFDDIKELVINSRNKVYQTVNTEMLNLYWNIGRVIMGTQQSYERASYGDAVLDKLTL